MAFNTFVLDQLNNPPEELAIEILKILNATSYALPCAEIFKLSKEAVTSRDISLEMSQTLKPKGLVEIDRKERKPGVGSDIAFWKITQAGKDFLQSTNTKLPEDITPNYDPPIFGQTPAVDTVVAEIEKFIDTPSEPVVTAAAPDYSDKPKAYQILKYIEQHPGCASKPIQYILGLTSSIKPYIAGYLDRGEVIQFEDDLGLTYQVTKPVDEFYRHHKPYEKKSAGATQHDSIPETKATPKTHDDSGGISQAPSASVEKTDAADEIQKSAAQQLQDQVVNDPAEIKQSRYRFAYTNDRCLMIFQGKTSFPIELTSHETQQLLTFVNNQLSLQEAAV